MHPTCRQLITWVRQKESADSLGAWAVEGSMTMKGSKNAMTSAVIKPSAGRLLVFELFRENDTNGDGGRTLGHVDDMTPICHPEVSI
jgi:hypothetical protein